MEGHACSERKNEMRGEDWAAVDTADLGGGGHADLGDKCVIKKAENLLPLDLLGWGVFGRRRDGWAFPELWASKGGAWEAWQSTAQGDRDKAIVKLVSHSQATAPPRPLGRTNESLLP